MPPKLTPRDQMSPAAQRMHDIADVLEYPVDHQGRRYDLRFLIPILSFHLARAGCVVDPDLAVIKRRKLPPAPGVVEDAIEWVSVHVPDTVEDELDGVTLADVGALSPAARAEFIRRAGGDGTAYAEANPDPNLDERTPWHVETRIHIDD